ncbi:MAG: competence/damage-inducible protein A [Nitriliruptorales bacterium]|nr:competence/damage-inducible protein A [Nitriliruptorales bacterium]
MRAEIVAVGSELLLGQSVDTNSAWISARLAEIGVDVFRHVTVGDNVDRMVTVLSEATARADAVIVTGGLGPTQDDVTRVAVARLAGASLRRRQELVDYLEDYFQRRRRPMPANNLVQADLPEGARMLPPVGSAAGFALDVGSATVFCVPGVPREMEVMVARDVLPALTERGGLAITISRVVRTSGMAESAVAETLAPLVDRLEVAGNPTIAFLASRGETRVRITGKAVTREAALALVDPIVEEALAGLGPGVVGLDDEGPEYLIARRLQALGLTLGVAESVSGGNLAARLVVVPGASEWFRGGLVVYATPTKVSLAGLEPDLLERYGPVSEETAAALALAACERLEADVGVGVVGVAGPTTQGGRDMGTVCLGVVLPDGLMRTRELRVPGRSRSEVQEWAASTALDMVRRRLAEVL